MYVTRPLSLYKNSPAAISEEPPPGTGFLAIQDDSEEDEQQQQGKCFMFKEKQRYLKCFPFPQDRELVTEHTIHHPIGVGPTVVLVPEFVHIPLHFLPVIDQPLSSSCYYVLRGQGKYQGLVSTCSTRDNMGKACFCCRSIKDVKPEAFDRKNTYQQVKIVSLKRLFSSKTSGFFHAKSVAPDGIPESFLRFRDWGIYRSRRHVYPLSEANGVDEDMRARMPGKSFPGPSSSHVVVGRWYCPYIFVREDDMSPKDQFKKSMFYSMTLEQFWEEIYACERSSERENFVTIVTRVETERSSMPLQGSDGHGTWWFRFSMHARGGIGLDAVIVEKMRREEEKGGWVKGKRKVETAEEFRGDGEKWRKFRCFVLVERFVLKRMDGTLLLRYDFKHTNKIMSKWE